MAENDKSGPKLITEGWSGKAASLDRRIEQKSFSPKASNLDRPVAQPSQAVNTPKPAEPTTKK